MGCGSSTASRTAAPGERDPEDVFLEHVDFKKFGIKKFDDFCEDLEEPVNTIVDIANEINGCIDDVKEAVALVLGAYQLQVELTNAADHDRALLSFTKADGTFPSPDEVARLDDKARAADVALSKAHLALNKSLPKGLKVVGDFLAPAEGSTLSAAAKAFNDALKALREAVGKGYLVKVTVAPAAVPGGPSIHAALLKPVFKDHSSTKYELEPLTVLSIAKSQQAKAIFAAQATVAKASAGLAKAIKAMPEGSYKLKLKKRRLTVKVSDKDKKSKASEPKQESKAEGPAEASEAVPVAEAEEEEEDEPNSAHKGSRVEKSGGDDDEAGAPGKARKEDQDGSDDKEGKEDDDKKEGAVPDVKESEEDIAAKKAAAEAKAARTKERSAKAALEKSGADLKKAVSFFNAEVFKLGRGGQNAFGPVSVGRGLVAVLEASKKWALANSTDSTADISKLLKLEPKISTNADGELDFDLGIKVTMPDGVELSLDKLLTKLPGPVQLVYGAVMSIKTRVKEMIPLFSKVKDEAMQLIETAETVFADPAEAIQEELEDIQPAEMIKLGTAVGANLLKIKEAATIIAVFIKTINRVADELSNSFEDLKKALGPTPVPGEAVANP